MAKGRLELKDLLNMLSHKDIDLSNEEISDLVLKLGVRRSRIKNINNSNSGPIDKRTDCLQAWLQIEPDQTWKKISDVLRNGMDMVAAADKIDELELQQTAPPAAQQQPVQQPIQPVKQAVTEDADMGEDEDPPPVII